MISWFYGRKVLQSFYKKLYSFSLKGLNYGIVGSGEKWVLHFVYKNISSKILTAFDVGANIGEYSKDLRDVFGEHARILAFEPVPATFLRLNENKDKLAIETFNLGLGKENSTLEINYSPDQHTFSSVFDRKAFSKIKTEKIPIEIQSLDSFCRDKQIEAIDFVKIDTEGNDFACIQGARQLLKEKKIKYLQFEFGESAIDAGVHFRSFWELLSSNYKIYRVLKDGLEEIDSYHVRHETFYYSNFLAQVK